MNPQNAIDSDDFLIQLRQSLSKSGSESDNKYITVLASTCSVVVLMLLGSCIWCFTNFCKRRNKFSTEDPTAVSKKRPESFLEACSQGGQQQQSSETLPRKMNGSNNGNKDRLGVSRNIITPDKTIEFVIPTIPLPAQPPSLEPDVIPAISSSTSETLLRTGSIRKEHFPQLTEEEEVPKIGFSLYYEANTQILYVRLLAGKNMPENVRHTIAVKLYPGRSVKQKTREYEDANPIYNQEFSFHIRQSTLCTRVLRFKAVLMEAPKRVFGSLNLSLKDIPGFETERMEQDLQSTHIWRRLDQGNESAEGIRLRVSLEWKDEPPPGLLTLKIMEATGLQESSSSFNEYTSSYVKVTLQEQQRHIKSRKTRLVRWTSFPVYDDTFVVTIPHELLGQVSFLLEIMARGRLGSKVMIGKMTIGSALFANPCTEAAELWEDMCHQPNIEVTKWLQLAS